MVSRSASTMDPYAQSSASPFELPTPVAVRLLPPSTYAVTVAAQPAPFGAYVALLGLAEEINFGAYVALLCLVEELKVCSACLS